MRRDTRRILLVVPTLLAGIAIAAMAACDNGDVTGPDEPAAVIDVRGNLLSYNPETVTINAGETVGWTWSAANHSVTSVPMVSGVPGCAPDGVYDSGVLPIGSTFTRVFPTPGTYGFACTVAGHCAAFESGTVVVQ
jgi:plastocyanin